MKANRRTFLVGALVFALVFGGQVWWSQHRVFHYLDGETAQFVEQFAAPTAPGSPQTTRELAALLELQRTRTPAEVAAAQADRKKDVSRFYAALSLDAAHPPALPRLHELTDDVEADIGPYVRAAKEKFRRLRPYEIEPALEPCIDDVKGDLSYPSGHAAYGYTMAYLLTQLVPERGAGLMQRADEFARQRLVCGVHYPSDIEAGRAGAHWLFLEIGKSAEFRRDSAAAATELRAALNLPERAPQPE